MPDQKVRVVIADDDPDYRRLLDKLITAWGYETVVVPNGYEATQAIRKMPKFKSLPIIAITAKHNGILYRELMGFPDDLPDLARLQPPEGNSRPDGVKKSCYAQRERKRLPKTY